MKTGSTLLLFLLLGLGLPEAALAQVGTPGDGSGFGGERVIIRWPNRMHGTLQEAVDAVPNGGTLRIAEGEFEIAAPVFVRGKRITIEGRGCNELPNRPSDNLTHLVGPPGDATGAVTAASSLGLFTFVSAGGVVRNLKLSGFDAGIRGFDDETAEPPAAEPSRRGLELERVCVADTGRGVAWSSRGALTIENAFIHNVSWNGLSVFPGFFVDAELSPVTLDKLIVNEAGNSCITVIGGVHIVTWIWNTELEDCGFGGSIVALNADLWVRNSTILRGLGPGIATIGGNPHVESTVIHQTRRAGIELREPLSGLIEGGLITETQPALTSNLYGDGVDVFGGGAQGDSGPVFIEQLQVINSTRAGVANFGNFVSLRNTKLACAAFELAGEPHLGESYVYEDRGGNNCGCPTPLGNCVVVSAGLAPPPPLVLQP